MSLGATYSLVDYDAALAHVQQELVRLGFLGRVTGRWDWDTYAAIGYAANYIGMSLHDTVHAAAGTIDVNDDWVRALEAAAPAPAGTAGLWAGMPHRSTWAGVAGWLLGAAALGGIAYWWGGRRCRR